MDAKRKGIITMAVCAIMWSIGGVLIKLLPWHPMVIAGFRGLFAAMVLAIYIYRSGLGFIISARTIKNALMLCALFSCFVVATKLTTAANAIVLQYCAPILLLIYSAVFRKQRFRAVDCIVVILTVLGIVIFFVDQLGSGSVIGNCVALLSSCFFCGMFISSADSDDRERFNGFLQGHLLTAIVGLPFMLASSTVFTLPSAAYILALGILQLGVPFILYGIAVKTCPPLVCSILAALEPLLNPVWVFLFAGEAPSMWALIGGAIVIFSVTAWCVWDGLHEKTAGEQQA